MNVGTSIKNTIVPLSEELFYSLVRSSEYMAQADTKFNGNVRLMESIIDRLADTLGTKRFRTPIRFAAATTKEAQS